MSIIGLLALGYGGYETFESYQASSTWQRAEAQVTHLEQVRGRRGRISYKPHFSFRAKETGLTHRGKATVSGRSYSRGQKIVVLYPADDPDKAKIDDIMELWIFPFIILAIGLIIAGAGFTLLRPTKQEEDEEETPEESDAPADAENPEENPKA